jgi:hypothetical protein
MVCRAPALSGGEGTKAQSEAVRIVATGVMGLWAWIWDGLTLTGQCPASMPVGYGVATSGQTRIEPVQAIFCRSPMSQCQVQLVDEVVLEQGVDELTAVGQDIAT